MGLGAIKWISSLGRIDAIKLLFVLDSSFGLYYFALGLVQLRLKVSEKTEPR